MHKTRSLKGDEKEETAEKLSLAAAAITETRETSCLGRGRRPPRPGQTRLELGPR